jgi:hypothetical protein
MQDPLIRGEEREALVDDSALLAEIRTSRSPYQMGEAAVLDKRGNLIVRRRHLLQGDQGRRC